MSEDLLDSEDQEVVTQEIVEDESTHEPDLVQQEADIKAEEQERNWKAMRQRQREMEISLKQKDDLINKFLERQEPVKDQEIVEEEEPDDSYTHVGGVKKIAKRAVQPLEDKVAKLEAKLAAQEQQKYIEGFKRQYPDFDDVVNVETLELLEKREPELAETIAQIKDPYKMGLQSYKFIKALGIVEDVPTARRVKEVEKKLEKNKKTVQSPQSFEKRPMAQAFKSTEADKTRLYEEMMHYASKASGI